MAEDGVEKHVQGDTNTIDQVIYVGAMLYDRFLTDAAGGNVSAKVGERIYVSPRYAGARYHWRLTTELVNVLDLQRNVLQGPTPISRESDMHLALYEAFPQIGSVIHAHAPNLMVFSTMGREMPAAMEYTDKFGTIGLVQQARSHTPELAVNVVAYFRPLMDQFDRHALGALLPRHGAVVIAHDLLEAYDTLERLENNARCLLAQACLRAGGLR